MRRYYAQYPRAVVNRIDLSKALAHPDCIRILTEKDVPNKKIGHLVTDWDVMIAEGGTTRYIGDALALVATQHKEMLDEVLELIEVDYTELVPITCPTDALKASAPLIHEQGNIMRKEVLKRGNADAAIKKSKYVVTRKYSTPFNDHAFMEPECAIALPEGEDGLLLYTGSQSVYDERHEISHVSDSRRKNTLPFDAGWGRIWRQRRYECAASCRIDGLVYEKTGESEVFATGKFKLSYKTSRNGNGIYDGL